jgi:tRNA U34 5-methylaminomethyl-2-thiouridine-forming methyltransferase MnmC
MSAGSQTGYRLVQLANGTWSVHSLQHGETFHPAIGPAAEAEALYVRQLRLPERVQAHGGEFVIWDVGLGAAANALTVLRATRAGSCPIRLLSFDSTLAPLLFALEHTEALGYLADYQEPLRTLLQRHCVHFPNNKHAVAWTVQVADFPTLLNESAAKAWPKPHVILFDAYSPAKNPEMWTQPLFARLYQTLDPQRPCALATYSRSTMLRVSLLLAGFFVGAGEATGQKDETTIAANARELIADPLDSRWLQRVRRSNSAEPLWDPVYRQARLAPETWEKLREHRQFN